MVLLNTNIGNYLLTSIIILSNEHGIFDDYGMNMKVYFKVGNSDINGASPLRDNLFFTFYSKTDTIPIFFFNEKHKVIKEIKNGC